MNNFFYNSSEYSLFRKALKDTTGEPILINILSTDPSLNDDKQEVVQPQRKNQSSKFEPTTPFGKFFGARKATRTTPVDMKDFSSWKNKNYRKVEQNINNEEKLEAPKFSLSDYMNKTMGANKFNDSDQLTTETQKPINELSTDDPLYKRFSLDSYLHKLEEQNKSKNKFKANDDLLEPLGDLSQNIIPDSSQDEDFGLNSEVNVEGVAFDENISGEKFSFDQSELDKVKTRLEKMEKEAANIKEKATTKVINTNELSSIAHDGEEEGLDINKLLGQDVNLNEDDIDKVNKKLGSQEDEEISATQETSKSEPPKVKNKTFLEINRNEGFEETTAETPLAETEDAINADSSVDSSADSVSDDDADDFDKLMQEINEELDEEDAAQEDLAGELEPVKVDDVSSDDEDEEDTDIVDDAEGEDVSGETIDEVDETEDTNEDGENALEADPEVIGRTSHIKPGRPEYVTKDDLQSMSEELLEKFTNMNRKEQPSPYYRDVNINYVDGNPVEPVEQVIDAVTPAGQTKVVVAGVPGFDGNEVSQTSGVVDGEQPYVDIYGNPVDPNNHLQTRILEMIEENKKADAEARAKLKLVEDEKNKMAEEYESRLKDLEQAFKKKDEETKQKAYLDKLKSDIKLKKAESNFKLREQRIKEFEKESSEKQKIGVMLRKELKNNLNISNLEMDKKLLEVASKIRKEYEIEQEEELRKVREQAAAAQSEVIESQVEEEVEEEEEEKPKTTKKSTTSKTTKKKTTRRSHSHTRTARRKIDSDIIGGINFE